MSLQKRAARISNPGELGLEANSPNSAILRAYAWLGWLDQAAQVLATLPFAFPDANIPAANNADILHSIVEQEGKLLSDQQADGRKPLWTCYIDGYEAAVFCETSQPAQFGEHIEMAVILRILTNRQQRGDTQPAPVTYFLPYVMEHTGLWVPQAADYDGPAVCICVQGHEAPVVNDVLGLLQFVSDARYGASNDSPS